MDSLFSATAAALLASMQYLPATRHGVTYVIDLRILWHHFRYARGRPYKLVAGSVTFQLPPLCLLLGSLCTQAAFAEDNRQRRRSGKIGTKSGASGRPEDRIDRPPEAPVHVRCSKRRLRTISIGHLPTSAAYLFSQLGRDTSRLSETDVEDFATYSSF